MRILAASVSVIAIVASQCGASIVSYTDAKQDWLTAVGPVATLDFVGSGSGTQIVPADYYSSVGVQLSSSLSTSAFNWQFKPWPESLDGWVGSPATPQSDSPALNFTTSQTSFAMEVWAHGALDSVTVIFYNNGTVVDGLIDHIDFDHNYEGVHFWGWTTSFAFDRVVVQAGHWDTAFVTVPGPASAIVIAAAAMARRRRRVSA